MADPVKGVPFTFHIALTSQGNRPALQSAPTLAAGDVLVAGGNGAGALSAFANIATLPTVSPAGSVNVLVTLSAAEMNFDHVVVLFRDVAGFEWDEKHIYIATNPVSQDTVPTDVATLVARLTAGRAAALDLLDAAITSRHPNGAALPASAVLASGITAGSLTAGALTAIADALLTRDWLSVNDLGVVYSALQALRALRNDRDTTTTPGMLTVFKENGSTVAWQANVTTSPTANPVVRVDNV